MGSCALKLSNRESSRKDTFSNDLRTDKQGVQHFSNPMVRARIFKRKDSKTPRISLKNNQLRNRRLALQLDHLQTEA
jgi:hypothetical protein